MDTRLPGEVQAEMLMRSQTIIVLDGAFAVCRLAANAPTPPWASAGSFSSITRTPDELSIVCAEGDVPEGVKSEKGWRCLRVAGTIDFDAVGVLAALAVPLAAAGVGVFAVSTFDTDYLMVKGKDLPAALDALRGAGHFVQ